MLHYIDEETPGKELGNLIQGMPFKEYLTLEKYIHSSDIKKLDQSISHLLNKEEFEETPALKLGTLAHFIVTPGSEVANFDATYMVMPKVDRRTKQGRQLHDDCEAKAKADGKILITQEDYTKVIKWRDNIFNDPMTENVFKKSKGVNEISGFFNHPEISGIRGAIRVDKLLEDKKIAIDFKTAVSAHPIAFKYAIKKFRYDIQAAWYIDGLKALTGDDYDFLFVVLEKSSPYLVQVYRLSEKDINSARDDIFNLLENYKTYVRAPEAKQKTMTGYFSGIKTISLTDY